MLSYLEILDLAPNNLSGLIPKLLRNAQVLETLNVSHNMLSGLIPITFKGM
ncbi:hypothetical protein NC651_040527 [Populus alba x Populus x berolinensis]|nr:hypothetical protein NC651_040527 [Populus alba x Populus x berolinensis]